MSDEHSTLFIFALAKCPHPSLGPDLAHVVFPVWPRCTSISALIDAFTAYSSLFRFAWLIGIALLIFIIVSLSCN
jgi:hypothetical protein